MNFRVDMTSTTNSWTEVFFVKAKRKFICFLTVAVALGITNIALSKVHDTRQNHHLL
jgi:hypothetical protein